MLRERKKAVPKFNPESLNEFFSMMETADIIGVTEETLNYYAEMGFIPYKFESGEKVFRRGSIIRFKNGWEQIPIQSTGEKFAKDWK